MSKDMEMTTKQAADEARKLLRGLRGVEIIVEALDRVGAADQLAAEAQRIRADALASAEQANVEAAAARDAADRAIAKAKNEAADIVMSAKSEAARLFVESEQEAKAKVADVFKAAEGERAKAKKLADNAAKCQAEIDQLTATKAELERTLADLTAKIDAAREQARKLLGV